MELTRKQFGIAILGAFAAFLFGNIFKILGRREAFPIENSTQARFWSRTDKLAG